MDVKDVIHRLKVRTRRLTRQQNKLANMPKRIKQRWPFTKKDSNINISKQDSHLQETIPSATLYRNIIDLPLYLFIDAIVDDKIHSIVISGDPSPKELHAAWSEIIVQYNESMGNADARLHFSLYKQILQKKIDLELVIHAVTILRREYVPEMLKFLNELFYCNVVLDFMDRDAYENKLISFINRSKGIVLAIDMKTIHLEAIEKKNSTQSKKPDRKYFQTMLLNLSDHAKYEINDRISTFQFCERIQRLNHYIEEINKRK